MYWTIWPCWGICDVVDPEIVCVELDEVDPVVVVVELDPDEVPVEDDAVEDPEDDDKRLVCIHPPLNTEYPW